MKILLCFCFTYIWGCIVTDADNEYPQTYINGNNAYLNSPTSSVHEQEFNGPKNPTTQILGNALYDPTIYNTKKTTGFKPHYPTKMKQKYRPPNNENNYDDFQPPVRKRMRYHDYRPLIDQHQSFTSQPTQPSSSTMLTSSNRCICGVSPVLGDSTPSTGTIMENFPFAIRLQMGPMIVKSSYSTKPETPKNFDSIFSMRPDRLHHQPDHLQPQPDLKDINNEKYYSCDSESEINEIQEDVGPHIVNELKNKNQRNSIILKLLNEVVQLINEDNPIIDEILHIPKSDPSSVIESTININTIPPHPLELSCINENIPSEFICVEVDQEKVNDELILPDDQICICPKETDICPRHGPIKAIINTIESEKYPLIESKEECNEEQIFDSSDNFTQYNICTLPVETSAEIPPLWSCTLLPETIETLNKLECNCSQQVDIFQINEPMKNEPNIVKFRENLSNEPVCICPSEGDTCPIHDVQIVTKKQKNVREVEQQTSELKEESSSDKKDPCANFREYGMSTFPETFCKKIPPIWGSEPITETVDSNLSIAFNDGDSNYLGKYIANAVMKKIEDIQESSSKSKLNDIQMQNLCSRFLTQLSGEKIDEIKMLDDEMKSNFCMKFGEYVINMLAEKFSDKKQIDDSEAMDVINDDIKDKDTNEIFEEEQLIIVPDAIGLSDIKTEEITTEECQKCEMEYLVSEFDTDYRYSIECEEFDEECELLKEFKAERFKKKNKQFVEKGRCTCCYCQAMCSSQFVNKCQTVGTTDSKFSNIGPIDEMKYFINTLIVDLESMEHARRKFDTQLNLCNKKPTLNSRNSYPVSIITVDELGSSSLFMKWQILDIIGIGGYEIYVDGRLTNRYFSPTHQAAVVTCVDVTRPHKVTLMAQPQNDNDFYNMYCTGEMRATTKCKPLQILNDNRELDKTIYPPPPSSLWVPSTYLYDPVNVEKSPPVIKCCP